MADPAITPCLRCSEPLRPATARGAAFESCPKCNGSLIGQGELARVLEALSVELMKAFNPDAQIDPCPNRDGRLTCPRCAHPMERGDYCQAGLVIFDRCEPCGVLWLDPGELGVMTLMWARMEARWTRTHAENEAVLRDAQMLVDTVMVARRVRWFIRRGWGYDPYYDPYYNRFDPLDPL